AFFHSLIVSRRHRANRMTSSSGGTASSSPYAVNMRQRTYSRGGNGRNGARRYQSRARALQARRTRSSATRGPTTARRATGARVVNASPVEIALAPSISVALSAVAEALDYGRRPRVIVTSLDFPTVAYQWLAKRPRGVELVVVESPDRVSVPVEAIARAVDER